MRNILLSLICIFCLVACNSENTSSNSVSDCPIANKKLAFLKDTNKDNEINKLPTVNQFFESWVLNSPISNDVKVTWDNPKENYYIFNIDIIDIVTNAVNNIKLGMMVVKSGRVLVTDVWDNDEKVPNDGLIYLLPIYQKAIELAVNEKTLIQVNGSFDIQLGTYITEYSGGSACFVLFDSGEGFFEAETNNRVKWEQKKSELVLRIFGEEGSPQFSEVKAQIISPTSFTLGGFTYNLVQQ